MTRGRCGSLSLHRMTFSFTTPRRFDRRTRRNEMKSFFAPTRCLVVVFTLAGASALFGQAPPQGPPPNPGAYASVSGTISQLNYGPEMEVTSFLVNGNTLVTFPPHVALALSSTLK